MITATGTNTANDGFYIQVQGRARERNNLSLSTRTKTGDINDYLETRRPFGANQ